MNAYEIAKSKNAKEVKYLFGFASFSPNGMLGGANYAICAIIGAKKKATSHERDILSEEQELINEWWDTVYEYALDHKCTVAAVSATELCAALNEYGFMHQSAAKPRA